MIDSGIKAINIVTNGGLKEGSLIEIFGDEQSGKTGSLLTVSKKFESVIYFDMDNTFPHSIIPIIMKDSSHITKISLTSDRQWVDCLDDSINFPPKTLLVFDPISVINPYLVSAYIGKIMQLTSSGKTVILVSHSNSLNRSPIHSTAAMFCSQRLEYRYIDKILRHEEKQPIGFRTKIRAIKNASSSAMKTAIMEVYFDTGIK